MNAKDEQAAGWFPTELCPDLTTTEFALYMDEQFRECSFDITHDDPDLPGMMGMTTIYSDDEMTDADIIAGVNRLLWDKGHR